MATKANTNKKAFLAKLRGGKAEAASPKKSVHPKLELMVERLLDKGIAGELDFDQSMAVGALALKIEAVRNKIGDDDYGSGFINDDSQFEVGDIEPVADGTDAAIG